MGMMKSKNITYLVEETLLENEMEMKKDNIEVQVKTDLDTVKDKPSLLILRGDKVYDKYLDDFEVEELTKKLGKIAFSKHLNFTDAVLIVFMINYFLSENYKMEDIFVNVQRKHTNETKEEHQCDESITFDSVNMDIFLRFKKEWFDAIQKCKEIYQATDLTDFNKEYLEKYLPKIIVVSTLRHDL